MNIERIGSELTVSDILSAVNGGASHKRRLAGLGDLRFNIPEGMLAVPRYRYPYPPSENVGFGVILCFLHPVRLMEGVPSTTKGRIPILSHWIGRIDRLGQQSVRRRTA